MLEQNKLELASFHVRFVFFFNFTIFVLVIKRGYSEFVTADVYIIVSFLLPSIMWK